MDIKHKGVINTNILKKNMSHVVRLSVTILFVIISAIRPATTNGMIQATNIFKYSIKGFLKPSLNK